MGNCRMIGLQGHGENPTIPPVSSATFPSISENVIQKATTLCSLIKNELFFYGYNLFNVKILKNAKIGNMNKEHDHSDLFGTLR